MQKSKVLLFSSLIALALGGWSCQFGSKTNINSQINETSNQTSAEVDANTSVDLNNDIIDNTPATTVNSNINGDTSTSANAPVTEPTPAPTPAPTPTPTPTSAPVTKTFNLSLQRFSFSPSTITVGVGDKVVINATAVDTTHGLSLPDFGVGLVIPQGQTQTATFIASKAGTYTFRCSVYCGAGHTEMTGTLIVK